MYLKHVHIREWFRFSGIVKFHLKITKLNWYITDSLRKCRSQTKWLATGDIPIYLQYFVVLTVRIKRR